MKFKDLTDEQIEESRKIYWNRELKWDERMKILMKKFNKSERTVRKWCVKLGFKENTYDNDSEQYKIAQKRVFDKTKSYYLITWAQNNTPVHERFFDNLKAYAEFLDADLHVIAGRYRNPTSVFSDVKHDVWDKKVIPYLDATRNEINNHVTILSDVKIQPTAVNPMTGMQGFSVKTSCIFGSPKVQLQSIPVIHKNEPRVMMTTGACTKKNYTDSKAGKKGEFHHTYGAVIVEVKDLDKVFVRQITARDDGDFNDLYFNVSNGVVRRNEYIEAIIYGDIHAGEHDQSLLDETRDKILDKLKPKNVILHDVFSGLSINPHEAKDVFLQYGKQLNGHDDLKKELDILIDVLAQFKDQEKVVIVRSNHDVFLDRWLKNEDWKKQPSLKNSRLYMRLSDMLLKQYEDNPYKVKGVIPEIINDVFPEYITLGLTDSYKVKGFELGMHGHIGINGARPGVESFRKLNTKIVSAHTHSAFRKDGLVVCGTSTKLKLNYNHGPSSWTQGHTIIDNYGKAQSIIFFDGEFTTFE